MFFFSLYAFIIFLKKEGSNKWLFLCLFVVTLCFLYWRNQNIRLPIGIHWRQLIDEVFQRGGGVGQVFATGPGIDEVSFQFVMFGQHSFGFIQPQHHE
jgi:hypothetical protein